MATTYAPTDTITLSVVPSTSSRDGWTVLPPQWELGGKEALLRINHDWSFTMNKTMQGWMQEKDGAYLEFRTDPIERRILVRRHDGMEPMAAYAGSGMLKHYGLSEVLQSHGYANYDELKFEESDDPDELQAVVWTREGK